MNEQSLNRRGFLLGASAVAAGLALGADFLGAAEQDAEAGKIGEIVKLPAPDGMGGKTLRECLDMRRAEREISPEELDLQTMGNLFWAAWGINREDGRRTTPTARNFQYHTVFAVRGDGVWEYLPKEHAMKKVLAGDQRGRFDGSGCILLFAGPTEDRFSQISAGAMTQNVGLYCAAAGLANCVKATGRETLNAELPLPEGWSCLIIQSVGKRK